MTRLLMIDDDEKLVALMEEYLAGHGFQVESAGDGETGLAAALAQPPELVILDLMLPGLDGLEVCRRLRQSSSVPVLMLTARGEDTERIVGLELGADDYLAKPFNTRELLARIRAILRRARPEPGEAATERIQVGSLTVDSGTRSVSLHGNPVELTSTEFDLLRALARNRGMVLSREQLLEQMHGPNWAAYDRSIDVHISRLRQKIERDPRHPELLKTVRGAGYQLVRGDAE
ncbi:CpxR [Acidobacteria bacterium Mor1]|nr:CpxR [Acidobacteria bacterium Mor1]